MYFLHIFDLLDTFHLKIYMYFSAYLQGQHQKAFASSFIKFGELSFSHFPVGLKYDFEE